MPEKRKRIELPDYKLSRTDLTDDEFCLFQLFVMLLQQRHGVMSGDAWILSNRLMEGLQWDEWTLEDVVSKSEHFSLTKDERKVLCLGGRVRVFRDKNLTALGIGQGRKQQERGDGDDLRENPRSNNESTPRQKSFRAAAQARYVDAVMVGPVDVVMQADLPCVCDAESASQPDVLRAPPPIELPFAFHPIDVAPPFTSSLALLLEQPVGEEHCRVAPTQAEAVEASLFGSSVAFFGEGLVGRSVTPLPDFDFLSDSDQSPMPDGSDESSRTPSPSVEAPVEGGFDRFDLGLEKPDVRELFGVPELSLDFNPGSP